MKLHVMRCQIPVGQGCFHAGSLNLDEGSNRLHYVYDCGGENQRDLRRQVNRYREHTSSVCALFVSHFHSDHVSGLDELLSMVSVHTVYIPYVNDMILLLDIIEADMEGNISGSLIEASLDPASWFGLRGVQRVVRVMPGAPSAPPLAEEGDIDPDNGELRFVETPGATAVSRGRHARGVRVRADLLEMDRGILRVAALGRFTGWALVPYVHPARPARMADFKKRLRLALKLRSRQKMTSKILIDALRQPCTRKKLRQCYDGIIAGGSCRLHNRTSLSLYSGPITQVNGAVKVRWGGHGGLPVIYPPWWVYELPSDRVGWLGTGDADLNTNVVRDEWQRAFQSVRSHVSTLLLPHHGSCRNFHPDLLDFPSLQVCVASAGRPSRYLHPSQETIDLVNKRKKIFVHVSQRVESQFDEHVLIRY